MPGRIPLRLYASYGTAYKTPTFNELFFPFFGNPHLKPETAESYEAGLEGQHEGFELEYPGVSHRC